MRSIPRGLLIPALFAVVAIAALAVLLCADGSDADVHWSIDDQHNLTVTGSGSIPNGPNADWADIVTATISDGVSGIGNNAFDGCSSLTAVTVQGDMDTIGDSVFNGCSSLQSFTVQGKVGTMGAHVFYQCGAFTTFTVGGGIGTIGDKDFESSGLTTFTVGGDVGTIGNYAFSGCLSLAAVSFPGNVGDISHGAFQGCHDLLTFSVNGSAGDLGPESFYDCRKMTDFTVNGSVGDIGDSALDFCYELVTFSVNGSAGSIGDYAFAASSKMTTFTITGDFGPSIGLSAFNDCEALTSFKVPATVTSIGNYAFMICISLKTLYIPCDNPLGIQKRSEDYGRLAFSADELVPMHYYSASYDWSDDGKSCSVDISCTKGDIPDDVFAGDVKSKVIVEPTETEKGTTEYSVSGTYDNFDYYSKKDVQDIPATGAGSGGDADDKVLEHELIGAGAIIALALVGMVVLLRRKK